MEVLKLRKPIDINGQKAFEIKYDLDEMTAQDKINASKRYKKDGNQITVQELDPTYHLYLFAEAAAKADVTIDISDIMRMSAKDASKAEAVVRDFFFLDSEDISVDDTSDQQ